MANLDWYISAVHFRSYTFTNNDVIKCIFENVYVTLTFEPMTLRTYSICCPTVRNICVSFGRNQFSGFGAIAFT